jgi:hypothetical protein
MDHYAWVLTRKGEGFWDEFVILSPYSEQKYSNWVDLIACGQYAATGVMILDDATANQLLKTLGYERVTDWSQQPGGFCATVRKVDSWPEGSWGRSVNL